MIRLSHALPLILAVAGHAAVADEFCDAVVGLNAENPQLALAGGDAVHCTRSLALGGGAQLHCGWPFEYRATAATAAFDQTLAKLAACFGEVANDQDVNHPDFYDLRIFQTGDKEIGLSLKDKASFGQTYVFLRVTQP